MVSPVRDARPEGELEELAPISLWTARPDGQFDYVNQTWLRYSGMTLEEALGSGWMVALHPDDLGLTSRAWSTAIATGGRYEVEHRLRRRDGVYSWFLTRAVLLSSEDGTRRWHGADVDITDRKRTEEQLLHKQLQLQAVLDFSPALVSIKDPSGVIMLANRAFEVLDAPPLNEFVGKSVFDVFPREVAEQLWHNDLAALGAGGPVDSEESVRHHDGTWHTYLTVKFPIYREAGQPFGICAISNDITERKRAAEEHDRLQAQLAQAQKLESIGRLAGGIAHDFNNMLGAILGNAELALEQVEQRSQLAADLLEIRKAAQHSAELTSQLLAFARKQPIAPRLLDLNVAVEGVLKIVRRLVGEDLELVFRPGPDARFVRIDPTQLHQILTNLCLNSRDAKAKRITVTTRLERLERLEPVEAVEVAGEYVALSVRDDGEGMDAATSARLFEPFFTTKELGRGTGLGLSTIHGIVKQNAGHVTVQSEPGHGATFTVYLRTDPRDQVDSVAAFREDGVAPTEARATVLIVEDEQPVLRVTVRMLESLGFHALSAASPEAALRLVNAQQAPIHVLLTDLIMPGMNGRELAERVRALVPNIRCVFTSGYTSNVIEQQGVLDEGIVFLPKPFTRAALLRTLDEALAATSAAEWAQRSAAGPGPTATTTSRSGPSR